MFRRHIAYRQIQNIVYKEGCCIIMIFLIGLLIYLWYTENKIQKEEEEYKRCLSCKFYNTGVCSTCIHDKFYCLHKTRDQYEKREK
jgi:hypothetical protein